MELTLRICPFYKGENYSLLSCVYIYTFYLVSEGFFAHGYMISRTRIDQKALSLTWKKSEKQNSFSLFFDIIPLDIIAFSSMMTKYCNCLIEEGGILPRWLWHLIIYEAPLLSFYQDGFSIE